MKMLRKHFNVVITRHRLIEQMFVITIPHGQVNHQDVKSGVDIIDLAYDKRFTCLLGR